MKYFLMFGIVLNVSILNADGLGGGKTTTNVNIKNVIEVRNVYEACAIERNRDLKLDDNYKKLIKECREDIGSNAYYLQSSCANNSNTYNECLENKKQEVEFILKTGKDKNCDFKKSERKLFDFTYFVYSSSTCAIVKTENNNCSNDKNPVSFMNRFTICKMPQKSSSTDNGPLKQAVDDLDVASICDKDPNTIYKNGKCMLLEKGVDNTMHLDINQERSLYDKK